MHDRVLPGFAPDRQRIEIHATGDGLYQLITQTSSGPGLWSAVDAVTYEDLDASELIDVVSAILDSLWWV